MAKIKKLLEERVKSGEAAVKEKKRSWKKVREIWKKLELKDFACEKERVKFSRGEQGLR